MERPLRTECSKISPSLHIVQCGSLSLFSLLQYGVSISDDGWARHCSDSQARMAYWFPGSECLWVLAAEAKGWDEGGRLVP